MNDQPWLGDAWQEINLDALTSNLRSIRDALSSGVKICAVVKADAYGHGMRCCAEALWAAGADLIATASIREALSLRWTLPNVRLWAMGAASDDLLEAAVINGIALTICDTAQARRLGDIAESLGLTASIHIKLDTGFHRLGFTMEDAPIELPRIMEMSNVRVDGLFTHLALIDRERDEAQMARFFSVADGLSARGHSPMLHAVDSIAAFRYPQWRLGMVRVGAILYGNHIAEAPFTPHKVMRLCARIVSLRTIQPGDTVGYDEDYHVERPTLIATIPLGYADGLPRRLRESGEASVRGQRVRYAGMPCMDQSMLDVTGVPGVSVGDTVTVLGGDGCDAIPVEEFARWVGSNRNEPLAAIGRRVPRVYYENDIITGTDDPLLD
ncbi:alanine racemase [Clostridia bacterium]|nr:alanine racemase [Clostridia bacterium]